MTAVIHLPPQPLPKRMTARALAKSLGEHKQAFMNAHNRTGFQKDEEYRPRSLTPEQRTGKAFRALSDAVDWAERHDDMLNTGTEKIKIAIRRVKKAIKEARAAESRVAEAPKGEQA